MKDIIIGGARIRRRETEFDVYFDMALTMLDTILEKNRKGEHTVMIVPVGPTGQYPLLAQMVNRLNVSLKNVHFFNMDEYLLTPTTVIPRDDPMSFYGRMERDFYSLVREDLVMPPCQRHFPEPGKEKEYDEAILALGDADLTLGGLGINGHVAFNEPELQATAAEFAQYPTRVLPISEQTLTINAYGYQRGDIAKMPRWCITVGMEAILRSRKVYIALNRPWQYGPLSHALLGEETAAVPASLLRRVKDLTYCGIPEALDGIEA